MNRVFTARVLAHLDNGPAVDALVDAVTDRAAWSVDPTEAVTLRNLCAKVSVDLAEQVENACSMLGVSKRRFIELALVEALRQYESVAEEEGLFDRLDEFRPGDVVSSGQGGF